MDKNIIFCVQWFRWGTLAWAQDFGVLQMLQQKLTLIRWIVVEKHYDSHTSKCSTYINYLNTRTLISLQVFAWGNWGEAQRDEKESVSHSVMSLCNPRDCSLAGFTVHVLQARILESVAIPFPQGSSPLRDWTRVSGTAGRFFTMWATREAPKRWNCFFKEKELANGRARL